MSVDKKILSIDSDDDDKDYQAFSEFIEDNTKRTKNKMANEFNEIGEELLAEIDDKKERQEIKKRWQIKYILKHTKDEYTLRQLNNYSTPDVKNIYDEVKNKKSFLYRMFHFIFNL